MNKQIEEIVIAKNCAKCIHKAVCDKLEEFRDPLCWVDVNGKFGCSYYEKSTDVAADIITDVIEILNEAYIKCNKWEVEIVFSITEKVAELKKKYMEEADDV